MLTLLSAGAGTWLTWMPKEQNTLGFPSSSYDKAATCNAGDPATIPELGRRPGKGNGNPLQYSYLENSWIEETGGLQSMGVKKSQIKITL